MIIQYNNTIMIIQYNNTNGYQMRYYSDRFVRWWIWNDGHVAMRFFPYRTVRYDLDAKHETALPSLQELELSLPSDEDLLSAQVIVHWAQEAQYPNNIQLINVSPHIPLPFYFQHKERLKLSSKLQESNDAIASLKQKASRT